MTIKKSKQTKSNARFAYNDINQMEILSQKEQGAAPVKKDTLDGRNNSDQNNLSFKTSIMEYQSFKVWKINPSQQELDEEINVYKNIHGETLNKCILKIEDHTAVLIGEDELVKGVFSLHHFYIKNWTGN